MACEDMWRDLERETVLNLRPVSHPSHGSSFPRCSGHKGKEAATEFQKLLDHRGVVINSPLGALARLGIAQAQMVQNDASKSRPAYQDFLTLWKDADPNIPILQQAKAEYAKIH
jgi:hypothetical protein